ncbi:amidohydrolase family protein [Campylobacter sp. MIT 21-1685]|uniref:amidohydrolase family protein n=1 Tax=unclassified Campylobacter TaxID=2593542 RepID=UPI00224B5609|nr:MULTISPECIES: amidohydrolase family protein [unclassified Campylobacter]MCX2682563.1 amidohydrolase family protein [Campylobacter sp. MIT 21-1684]MCX2750724.1 amidohydrolase family protein [Campylobacter sp. MIT 21-1682]MCX2807044.1 amidohydrolase family protein [Campylobacter sp. MIT 21-1685]
MLIKNARIYGKELRDLEIQGGKIVQIGTKLNGTKSLDVQGATLLPSFVDLCVNLKDDKFSLENIDLFENECLKSGLSAVVLRDVMDFNEESFALFLQNIRQRKMQIFSSIKVQKNGKLKNLATLLNKGAIALELDSALNANFLRASMQYALMKDCFLFVRSYQKDFDDDGVMNDGQTSFELGLSGMSEVAETSEVAKMLEIAKFYGAKVVFDCISLKQSMRILKNQHALVSIHHLIKDDTSCRGFNTAAKLMPPLRSAKDVAFLKQALQKGELSFISSLHSPKSLSYKDLAFDEAAFGINSICDFISLCYTFLVKENLVSWEELCRITSLNPNQFLGINAGIIEVGKEANLVVFDEMQRKKSSNSLYANDTLFGIVTHHILKGENILFD